MKLTQQLVGGSGAVVHAQIEFVRDGDPSRRDASDVLDVPFESVARVRTPASWKHKRNYEGLYWAATIEEHVWFESQLVGLRTQEATDFRTVFCLDSPGRICQIRLSSSSG